MPTMWTLIKWLPWQQQLERPGSSSGIDRGAGVELTPAGGTRAEGGDTGPAPTYDPISGTRGLFQTPTGISLETQSGCHAQGWKRSHQKRRCHLSRQPPKTDALSCTESRFSWEPGRTRMHTRTHLSFQHSPPPVEADPPPGSCWVRETLHGDRHCWCHPLQRRVTATAMFLSGRLSSGLGWGCLQC